MSDSTNHGVVGTDGVIPSYNPEGLWKTWDIDELYMGGPGAKKYVGKVGDHAIQKLTGFRYYIKALSIDLIPTLEPLTGSNSINLNTTDLLVSAGPGLASQNYRAYYDASVFPYRIDISAFLTIRSVQAAYATLIYGNFQGENETISFIMDAAGNKTTDRVPLEALPPPNGDYANYRFKSVAPFFTNKRLVNGDQVTLVLYSASHHVVGHTVLTVTESRAMRGSNAATRYVTHISVASPFLSDTDPTVLELPMGWNKASMNITGQVHYSDGSMVQVPIDGRRMSLRGIDQVLSSIPDHYMDLTLSYSLPDGESSISEMAVFANTINQPMRVRIVDAQNSYSVKLYAIPYWDANNFMYRLKWMMLDLERIAFYDVTNHVQPAANSPIFDGMAFNAIQRFQVSLNLRSVFSTYKPYIHTQIVEVSLYGAPSDFLVPWSIRQVQTDPRLFGDVYAKIDGAGTVTLINGQESETDWLKKLYHNSQPLSEYPDIPDHYPTPTHFIVYANGKEAEYPISFWNRSVTVPNGYKPYDTIMVIFVRETSSSKLYLSFAPLTVQA